MSPEIPAEASELAGSLQRGDYVVCYATKCTPCQFGEHSDEPHTWMDSDDLDHAGIAAPATSEGWVALAKDKPCGCHCMKAAPPADTDRCPRCGERLYSPAETDAHSRLYHNVGPVETTTWGAEP